MNTPIIVQHSSQYRCQSWCVRVSCDGGGGDARQHDKWWLITAQLQPADTGPDRITTLLYWGQPRATVLHQPSQENKEEKHCSFLLVLDYAEVRGPLQCGCQWSSHHTSRPRSPAAGVVYSDCDKGSRRFHNHGGRAN